MKLIEDMTYTELLTHCERRPMWAVDKILKLTEHVKKLDQDGTEVIKLCWKVLDLLTPQDPDPDKNLATVDQDPHQQLDDFMADHAEG